MYLKRLEMAGFKSFMHKTAMEFEPGMTAIVGPNGCGKSNVSDALRWVLGEQSAKALRGSKMEDCIFNGTDSRKPLGMAEVSITFSDCETVLPVEYNEVTITRRVFRSGEGQYFLNKVPCRLKDIQRMFMDTGVGTTSYSLMEQGRIDRVLSARPEDRRAIFEEASGITKFKNDKQEAMRKLEHTEANLIRLADVIREVKRQIGSLQRQAGKARRYKELKDELRKLDIFATRKHLTIEDKAILDIESNISELARSISSIQKEAEEMEAGAIALRESRLQTEREKSAMHEAAVQAQSKLDHTQEMILMNRERIKEHQNRSQRDTAEIDEASQQINKYQSAHDELSAHIAKAQKDKDQAEQKLKSSNQSFERSQKEIDESRSRVNKLREDSVELESLASRLQNQLAEIEQSERSAVIRRERLSAEKIQLAKEASSYEKRQKEMITTLESMRKEVDQHIIDLERLTEQRSQNTDKITQFNQECADLQALSAARKAQIEILQEREQTKEDLPGGSRLLMDESNPLAVDKNLVMGAIADHLDVEQEYRAALEVALRSWLDAILVANPECATEIIEKLESEQKGPARLISLESIGSSPRLPKGDLLINHVKCADNIKPVLQKLIGQVVVVDSIKPLPSKMTSEAVYVTKNGFLVRGNGSIEFGMEDTRYSNPVSLKHLISTRQSELETLEKQIVEHRAAISALQKNSAELDARMNDARIDVETRKKTLAQKEGENQVISSEASEARDRLETVTWELKDLGGTGEDGPSEKEVVLTRREETLTQCERITKDVHTQTRELPKQEKRNSELHAELTEHKIQFAKLNQNLDHLSSQRDSLSTRISELHSIVKGRSSGIVSYEADMARLEKEIKASHLQITSLETDVTASKDKEENLRKNCDKQLHELEQMERTITEKRRSLEEVRSTRSEQEVQLAESRMRHQNQIERVTSEYSITIELLLEEPEPEWDNGVPSLDTVETRVAELNTKIEAMGPVNLVAIEEYKELEERYSFLTSQDQDLANSKQQLMDMIRKINRTTSDMFKTTFEQVNKNFETTFQKLFNGGSAKLVLVNEEDVLECGIEIIARPPGKRLQNVSLLSGGERTLTAVALLFAIYMIKPSPFCLLDELDAALDDTNIGRFVKVLQEFLHQSQFVVITHNRQTIAVADVVYGITMEEKGISRVVSMKFDDGKSSKDRQADPVINAPASINN